MKESDIAMRLRHFVEMATTQKEWEAEKAKELKEQDKSQANEILKLRVNLQKVYKEKDEVNKDKDNALAKLTSIFRIVAPAEVKREFE